MSIIFPSSNSWATPRSEQGQITTQNAQIILSQRIEQIDKVLLYLPKLKIDFLTRNITAPLEEIFVDEQHTVSLANLDITRYVVEKAKYNTLEFYQAAIMPGCFGKQYTNNTWYYEKNGRTIVLPNDIIKGNIQLRGDPITAYVISSAVYNYIYNNGRKDGILYVKNVNSPTGYYTVTYTDDLDLVIANAANNTPDIRGIKFRVYYTPLGESVKLNVPKTNPKLWQFCIPFSQQQPMVDNVTLGRGMQSLANRTGCEQKQVLRTIPSMAHYRKPGAFYREKDVNGKLTGVVWRLVKCQIQFYCDSYIRVLETWSKNWSLRSENVPIDRTYRSWKIPADIVQRDLLYQEYCLLTTKGKLTSLSDDSLFSEDAKKILLNKLKTNTTPYTQMECMWFYRKPISNNDDRQGVILSASSFGFGKSLVFSAKTKDNLSAGVQRVPKQTGDSEYQFCKDVYYCLDNGELPQMYVQIGEGVHNATEQGAYLYPYFYSDADGPAQINTPSGYALFKDANNANVFNVQKDPSEQLNFTYQLHLQTDSGFLVIGSTWASDNGLVKSFNGNNIKVWYLTSYIPASAEVMTSYYGVVRDVEDVDFSVDLDAGTITFGDVSNISIDGKQVVGICVTDENNQVLIGYNDNKGATFTANYTANYRSMYEALKDYLAKQNG